MSHWARIDNRCLLRVDPSSPVNAPPGISLVVDLDTFSMEDKNEERRGPNFAPQNSNAILNPPMGGVPQNPLPNPAHGLGGDNMEGGSIHGGIGAPQFRTLRDYMNPPRQAPSPCIVFPPHYATLNIRPGTFMDKQPHEAYSYFDYLANLTRDWASTGTQNSEVTSFSTLPKPFQPPPQAQSNTYQPPHKRSLEDTLQQFIQSQGGVNSRVDKTLDDIKSQLTLLTQALTLTEKGKLPAQPQPNPSRHVHSAEISNQPSSGHEQVQAITVLRSGKTIDKTILPIDPKGRREVSKVIDGKQPGDLEDIREVNLIESIVQEHFERQCVEDPLARMLMFGEGLDYLEVEKVGNFVNEDNGLEVCPVMTVGQWTPTFEPLTPNPIKPQPSELEAPTPERKTFTFYS
ncbi:hypothetical protein Acr_00g0069310 [Actinidia rufa]|uniref:Uncharacterized protein n=1 Tax=Actinidia rufa TaxID=165716 RepID=A0A7J0DQZ5_9ERIC|nr:hypothetical protein Acr_00g0069310 [Actinidia rufa]